MGKETLYLASYRPLSRPSCPRTRRLCQRRCCPVEFQLPPLMLGGALLSLYPSGIHHHGHVRLWNTPRCDGTLWWPGAHRSSRPGRWSLWSRGGQEGDLTKKRSPLDIRFFIQILHVNRFLLWLSYQPWAHTQGTETGVSAVLDFTWLICLDKVMTADKQLQKEPHLSSTHLTNHPHWLQLKQAENKDIISEIDGCDLLTIVTLSCLSSAEDRTDANQSSWSLLNPPLNLVNLCSRWSKDTETRTPNINVNWTHWCSQVTGKKIIN